ncbi:hypothetical protein ACF1AY_18640 [Streptomyces sp. NPDC014776]|uniref:hypothetical protein n=1 Tax=Streptomyces sp. NPDC014776 TaxID=3364909 RepID=UPI003701D717
MPRSRRSRAVLVAALALVLGAVSAGCGDSGALQGAGPTRVAVSPARLWPELTPAASPAYDIDEVEREVVKGVAVPGDDIRKVDPAAIVRAEIAAHPDTYKAGGKSGETFPQTARLVDDDCGQGPERGRCPVLKPYYRDLTGDGHDDLALGFRLLPGPMTAVRVYTVDRHRLVQVMKWEDAVSAVEVAGRSLVLSSPSDLARYEYRLEWTWDPDQKAMLLTHDEMVRMGGGHAGRAPRKGSASPSPSASGSASGSGSGSGSASSSASGSGSASGSASPPGPSVSPSASGSAGAR